MKGKTLIIAGITAAVIIICFAVYGMCSNTEVESEQLAVVFPMDEMVSAEMFEETINDLYKETLVKSETDEEESDIQEMAEAGEMSSDAENEEILLTDESTENPSETQTSNPSGGGDTTTQPSGGGTGGGTGPNGVDLDAIRAAFGGGGGQLPTEAPAGDHSGSNHGITMAQ